MPNSDASGSDLAAPSAQDLLVGHGRRVEAFLREVLASRSNAPGRLREAMAYSLFAGGKRLRPALVLESARACGITPDNEPSALAAAGAMELVHTFSLVHDDLPAMDDDDLRRGRPTNHKVFGEAVAILAGDALLMLAFELIATRADVAVAPRLIAELARAAGLAGMVGGQVLDVEGQGKQLPLDELRGVHRRKTGALLTAACTLGAIAARADETTLSKLSEFGDQLGVAFQIVDDLLDVTSTPEELGKATRKDANRGKNTYPALLGLEASRHAARDHLARAIEALRDLGPPAEGLRALARFVVDRTN